MNEIEQLLQTESAGIIQETLDFMLYECSLDEAPSAEEVQQWQHILQNRGSKFQKLVQMCQKWLNEESHAL
ncbi:MAG: dioxygenase [Neisseria sp.]|nr:dioxygenase [Neisseria sp.]